MAARDRSSLSRSRSPIDGGREETRPWLHYQRFMFHEQVEEEADIWAKIPRVTAHREHMIAEAERRTEFERTCRRIERFHDPLRTGDHNSFIGEAAHQFYLSELLNRFDWICHFRSSKIDAFGLLHVMRRSMLPRSVRKYVDLLEKAGFTHVGRPSDRPTVGDRARNLSLTEFRREEIARHCHHTFEQAIGKPRSNIQWGNSGPVF